MKIADKVNVVTGSTRGIGRAIVEACAREGAALIVNSRHEEAVREACGALGREGLRVSGIAAQEPGRATGKLYNLFGGGRLVRGMGKLMWYRAQGLIEG